MSILFTSDSHFAHDNIRKYCNRPFKTYGEMDKELIRRWNEKVKPSDTVYHLGDFAYGRNATREYVNDIASQLNGSVHFILGNHDANVTHLDWFFESVKTYDEVEVEGQRIVLFHYGLRTWHHDLRGVWHLYGHSHGGLPPLGKSMDVGVDSWGYAPVSFKELKEKMDARPVGKHPKFANYTPGEAQ